jgi:hypothetical protein
MGKSKMECFDFFSTTTMPTLVTQARNQRVSNSSGNRKEVPLGKI